MTQKTPQSHANQEVQIFEFTFRTLSETAQAVKNVHIRKATKNLKDITLQKHRCYSVFTAVELAGVRRPNSGAGPKRVPNVCCTCLKMQTNAEPKGLDGDSGHRARPREPSSREATQDLQSPRADDPHVSTPCPREMIPSEKEWTVPNPEEEEAQKKKTFQKKLKKQSLMAQEKIQHQ